MTDKQIIIDGKECRYWFRPNPNDYRKCSLRGKNDNCDEIKDCFVKELLGKLVLKEQECEELIGQRDKLEFGNNILEHERNKYKQALDEIEKQVKAINNECFYDASCDCNNCDMKNDCSYYRKFKTLDIINKAKDGE